MAIRADRRLRLEKEDVLPGEECSLHIDLHNGTARVFGPASHASLLPLGNPFESFKCARLLEEPRISLRGADGSLEEMFRPERSSVCVSCGAIVDRADAASHVAACEACRWPLAVAQHRNGPGRVEGEPCCGSQRLVSCSRRTIELVMEKDSRATGLELQLAAQITKERKWLYESLLSKGWHDDSLPPTWAKVLALRSEELALFPALARYFTGTACFPREGSPCSEALLYAGSLADKLSGSKTRVSSAEAEGEWRVFLEHFDEMRLEGSTVSHAEMVKDSKKSYGRHASTLMPLKGLNEASGFKSYGQYENQHWGPRGLTQEAAAHLETLTKPGLRSLSKLPRALVYRPRLQHIRNCRTRMHADRERGDTHSYVRFEPAALMRSCLVFDLRIWFRRTLCAWRGVLLLPVTTCSGAHSTLRCYGWQVDGRAVELQVPMAFAESSEWVEVGTLGVLVSGLVDCTVRVRELLDSTSWESIRQTMDSDASPARILSSAEALEMTGVHERRPRLPFTHVCLGWDGEPIGFTGWGVLHALLGDPAPRRLHVYSRIVTEHPSCATAKRAHYVLDEDTDELTQELLRV